jgi:hypothetical protein
MLPLDLISKIIILIFNCKARLKYLLGKNTLAYFHGKSIMRKKVI